MRRKLIRLAALVVMGASLSTGFAAAQSGTISTTGPSSNNEIKFRTSNHRTVENTTNATVGNTNPQTATSGAVLVASNTTAGGAGTGMAHNDSLLSTTVAVNNSGSDTCGCGTMGGSDSASIGTTGPNSNNQVRIENSNRSRVTNTSNLMVSNVNTQTATSGAAQVSNNTTGGSATSGEASNISTAQVTFNVTN